MTENQSSSDINLCYVGHRDFDAADKFGMYILIVIDNKHEKSFSQLKCRLILLFVSSETLSRQKLFDI